MKRLLVAAVVASGLLAPAVVQAKEITLTFSDDEQNALVQLLDGDLKATGLQNAQADVYFFNKIVAAEKLAALPPPPAAAAPAAVPADGEKK